MLESSCGFVCITYFAVGVVKFRTDVGRDTMPIYEFNCIDCGFDYEKIVSFSESTYPACPSCGSREIKRRMGKPAIHFRGNGFYSTENRVSNNDKPDGEAKANDEETKKNDESSSGESSSSPDADKSTEKATDKSTTESTAVSKADGP